MAVASAVAFSMTGVLLMGLPMTLSVPAPEVGRGLREVLCCSGNSQS